MRLVQACLLAGVAAAAAGCVEEVDPSLRADRAAAPGDAAAAPAATVEVSAAVRDCAVQLATSRVPAGTVAIEIRNQGGSPQELVLRGAQGEWESGPIPAGQAGRLLVALGAGSYTLGCPGDAAVPAGATLTVQ